MIGTQHKRGDTLALDCTWWQDDAGTIAMDLTGWTVTAAARHTSGVQVALTVTMGTPASGTFSISADATATAGWPLGRWVVDIQRVDGGGVTQSTETWSLELLEDIA